MYAPVGSRLLLSIFHELDRSEARASLHPRSV